MNFTTLIKLGPKLWYTSDMASLGGRGRLVRVSKKYGCETSVRGFGGKVGRKRICGTS